MEPLADHVAGDRQVKEPPRVLVHAPIPVGAGILDFLEEFPEHRVVGLLAIEEKIDHLADVPVGDLPVEVLVNHFGALLRRDVGEQVGHEIAGGVDVLGAPDLPRSVAVKEGQPGNDMSLDIADSRLGGLKRP